MPINMPSTYTRVFTTWDYTYNYRIQIKELAIHYGLFTLITTQENHQLGRFEIGEVTTEGVNNLIMKRSITTVTNQDGPYQLSTNTQGFFFNTYGNSNTKLI